MQNKGSDGDLLRLNQQLHFCFKRNFFGVDLFPEKQVEISKNSSSKQYVQLVYKDLVSRTVPENLIEW